MAHVSWNRRDWRNWKSCLMDLRVQKYCFWLSSTHTEKKSIMTIRDWDNLSIPPENIVTSIPTFIPPQLQPWLPQGPSPSLDSPLISPKRLSTPTPVKPSWLQPPSPSSPAPFFRFFFFSLLYSLFKFLNQFSQPLLHQQRSESWSWMFKEEEEESLVPGVRLLYCARVCPQSVVPHWSPSLSLSCATPQNWQNDQHWQWSPRVKEWRRMGRMAAV